MTAAGTCRPTYRLPPPGTSSSQPRARQGLEAEPLVVVAAHQRRVRRTQLGEVRHGVVGSCAGAAHDQIESDTSSASTARASALVGQRRSTRMCARAKLLDHAHHAGVGQLRVDLVERNPARVLGVAGRRNASGPRAEQEAHVEVRVAGSPCERGYRARRGRTARSAASSSSTSPDLFVHLAPRRRHHVGVVRIDVATGLQPAPQLAVQDEQQLVTRSGDSTNALAVK